MLYRIEINTTPSNIDFSDYVQDIDKVPYKTNNRDKTIIAEGYTFKLTEKCPYTIETDTRILFWRDTTLIHIGIVEKKLYDEDEHTYTVTVNHILSELKKRNTYLTRQDDGLGGYKTFMDLVLENTSEVIIEGIGYDLILYKDIIDLIVNEAEQNGITVDWNNTNFFDEPSFYWRCYEAGDSSLTEQDSPTVDTSKLYFLGQQLNCSGVNGIYAPSEFTEDMNADKPSLFDLLVQICVTHGINFIPKDATTFYAVSQRDAMPSDYLADDEMYKIETEDEITEAQGVEATYGTLDYHLWFSGYAGWPEWTEGSYIEGSYVLYNGNYYRANIDTSEEPTVGEGQYDWLQITTDIEMSFYISPNAKGDAFVQYNHRYGVKCENVQWMDNFNPIIVDTGVGYFAIPTVSNRHSCAKYLADALDLSFRHKTIICPAEKIIDLSLYEVDSIYIENINNDTVEIETNYRPT